MTSASWIVGRALYAHVKVMVMAALRTNSAHDIAIALVLKYSVLPGPMTEGVLDDRIHEDSVEHRCLMPIFNDALTVKAAEELPMRLVVKVTANTSLAVEHVLKALIDVIKVGNIRI